MANFKVCNWHLKDTRWGDNENNSVAVHSLCIDINKDEFCMIDYTVNALNGYKHEWNETNILKVINYCKPILQAMDVKGKLDIYGIEFPKTNFEI